MQHVSRVCEKYPHTFVHVLAASWRCADSLLVCPMRAASETSMKVLNRSWVQMLGLSLPLNTFPFFLLLLLW